MQPQLLDEVISNILWWGIICILLYLVSDSSSHIVSNKGENQLCFHLVLEFKSLLLSLMTLIYYECTQKKL